MFRGNRPSNMKAGHKVQISNLDFGVNDEDINVSITNKMEPHYPD